MKSRKAFRFALSVQSNTNKFSGFLSLINQYFNPMNYYRKYGERLEEKRRMKALKEIAFQSLMNKFKRE